MLKFSNMKNTQKGFIWPILLGIIVILVIGGGVYVYKNKKLEAPIFPTNTEMKNTDLAETVTSTTTTTNQPAVQYKFDIKNTPDYLISFSVRDCDDMTCSGAGAVTIKEVKSKALIQTINSDDLYFFKDTLAKTSTSDTVLYDEQSPIIVGDYNFDGLSDLAVRNGNNSGYGGPSYDIYLFNAANKKFALSKALTELASHNLGMFFVDKDRKLLTTYSKDGCCWHKTDQYQVINNQPVLILTLIEDASLQRKLYKSEKYGFQFSLPKEWGVYMKADSSAGGVFYILKPGQDASNLAGVLSLSEYKSNKGWDSLGEIEKYEQSLDIETLRLYPETKPRASMTLTNSDQTITWLSVSDTNQGNSDNFFLKDGTAYDLYYNQYKYTDAEMAEIQKIIRSFLFINK